MGFESISKPKIKPEENIEDTTDTVTNEYLDTKVKNGNIVNVEVFEDESNEYEILRTVTFEDTPEERVAILEEGIRLTEMGRDSALADLKKWRQTNTTESSHFEYHLPEIKNRLNRAEHRITSSRLGIDLIKAAPGSDEQGDDLIKGFISNQVLVGKTSRLRVQLSSLDKQETDFNEQVKRNHQATEKFQAELDEINSDIKAGDPDSRRLKLVRSDVHRDINRVLERYDEIMSMRTEIDALPKKRETIQVQIDEINSAGITDKELPKSIQEDPDFDACLSEADTRVSGLKPL